MAARTSRPARSDDAKRELANAKQRGVKRAWAKEKALVLEGKGTRDWTPEQQRELIATNRISHIEGHHMKSASLYPEYADDPGNIQFLDSKDHVGGAHGGNPHTPTNGFYNPATGEMTDFGDGPPQPVEVIQLTEPVYENGKEIEAQDKDTLETEVEEETVTAEETLQTEEETAAEEETVTPEDTLETEDETATAEETVTAEEALETEDETATAEETVTAEGTLETEEETATAEEAVNVNSPLESEGGAENQSGNADGGHDGGDGEDNGGGIDMD